MGNGWQMEQHVLGAPRGRVGREEKQPERPGEGHDGTPGPRPRVPRLLPGTLGSFPGCRLVITFLPRSERLLISWLQSPSAVILEPKKIKSVTISIVSPSVCHEVMGPDAMILAS